MTINYNLNNSELLTQQSVKNNFGRVGSCGVLENNVYTAQLQQNNGYTAQIHKNQYEDTSGYLRYPQNLGNPLIDDPKFGNPFEPIPYSPHTQHPGANSNYEPTISTPENHSNKFKEDKTNDKEQFENYKRDIDKFITDKYTKEVDILNSYTEVKSTVLNMLRGVFSNKCESYKNFEDRLTESLDIGNNGTSPPVEHTSQARSHKSNDANRNHPKNNFDLQSLNDMLLRYTGKNINLENEGPSSKNTIIDRMNYNDDNKDFNKKQTPNSFKQHELPISGVQSEDLKIDSKTTNGPRRTSYSFKHRNTVNDLTNLISENDDKLKQALENIQKMYKQYDISHTTNDTTVGESLDLLKNTFSKMSELSRTISNQKDNVSEYKVNSEEQLDKIEQDESEPVKSQKFPINVESSNIKVERKSSKTYFSPKSVRSKKITNVSQQAKLNVANEGASQLEDSIKIIDKRRSTIRLRKLSSQVGSLSLKDKSNQYGLKKFANSININNSKNIGKNVRLDIKTTTGVDEFDGSNVVRKSEYTENSRRSKKMNLKQVKNLKIENTSDNTQDTTHLYPKTPVNSKSLNISENKDNDKETRKRNVKIATADLTKLEFTKAVKSMGKTTSILSKKTTTRSMKVQNANKNSDFQGFNSSSNSQFHNEEAENPQAGILENMTQMRDISMKQISDKDSISVLETNDTNTVSPTNSSSTNIQDENNQNTGYFVFSKHAKYRRMSTPQRRERISKKDSENASLEEPNIETI